MIRVWKSSRVFVRRKPRASGDDPEKVNPYFLEWP